MYDVLIVGAGFSGLTLAERFAAGGKKVCLVEKRESIGGNCYDYTDENGILVQKYGPHIFHTKSEKVFQYISKFTKLTSYRHKVIAYYKEKYYPVPINRDTVNRFYNLNLKTDDEVKEFLETKKVQAYKISNSRDVVVSKFGVELYDAFVKNYTKKQWDAYPEEMDKSVLERLPIRYDTNPYYFDDPYQGMPENGFTEMLKKMMNNKNITLMTGTDFFKIKGKIEYNILIFTGRIDQFFDYKFGKLDYRCLEFEFETLNKGSFQPNSVVNYTDDDVKFTRITEFKKFYNTKRKKTVICRECAAWEGDPAYPVMNDRNKALIAKYLEEAKKLKNTYFAGRLGSYKYINIDTAILDALELYDKIKNEAE
jgi:UDP-galactopyranose mutase